MKKLVVMIKPASSICNMGCGYCFYADVAASRQQSSMGMMSRETAACIIKNIFCVLDAGDRITFAFQGGEPGLAGLNFFEFFTQEAEKEAKNAAPPGVKVGYTIQTNGMMIDEDWCAFFKRENFLVGLSLDGDAALHNQNRMDSHKKGTFARVMAAKKMLEQSGVQYNILCVLTAESSRRAKRIWDFILRENIRHIQFIPCLESLDEGKSHPAALSGEKFYRFYSELFLLWKRGREQGHQVHIRLFDDLAAILLAGQMGSCGLSGGCSPQIVVEADGSVYPCDFYVLDEYNVSNLVRHNLKEAYEAVVKSGFVSGRELPPWCADCVYKNWCMGGCKRMKKAVYGRLCGMKMFLDECLEGLLDVRSC